MSYLIPIAEEWVKYDKKTTRGKGRLFNSYDKSLLLFCSFLKHAQFGLYFDTFATAPFSVWMLSSDSFV